MLRCLTANRNEIAVRIIRACREYEIETVAVYAEGGEQSLHIHLVDRAICIGEASASDGYLNIDRIISAAQITGADVIRPGYGFLSESTGFAQTVEKQGIAFTGPTKKMTEMIGDKIAAGQTVHHTGIPVVPGSDGAANHVFEIENPVKDIGYPVVIRATSDGGGRGIRIVKKAEDLEKAFKEAKSEGEKYFDDDRVYVEALISAAKRVEAQVMGDGQDSYVRLGERDCSMQHKNQKLIEESPRAALTKERRQQACNDVVRVARTANYRSTGTIEFLITDTAHYFIEMNTRIQAEHTVTEIWAERDLVIAQLYLLEYNHLPFSQGDIQLNGHVMEARMNVENPEKRLQPTPGRVIALHLPQGFNVRVGSLLYHGYQVSPYYDSLVVRVIVKSHDRTSATDKLKVTLNEMVINRFPTTTDFLYAVLNYPLYRDGDAKDVDIKFLEKHQIVKGVEL